MEFPTGPTNQRYFGAKVRTCTRSQGGAEIPTGGDGFQTFWDARARERQAIPRKAWVEQIPV
ncbi:hypothetical protein JMUB6875_13490 [Nocardia sp. JMUB6875]